MPLLKKVSLTQEEASGSYQQNPRRCTRENFSVGEGDGGGAKSARLAWDAEHFLGQNQRRRASILLTVFQEPTYGTNVLTMKVELAANV